MVSCEFSNCPNPEKAARVISCCGPCKKTFHIVCARVSGPHLKACQENDGISWVCSACRGIREDVLLMKVEENKAVIMDLGKHVTKYFEVILAKMDTHSRMITELAAAASTSNAINAELLSARPSSANFPTIELDESFSAIHDRVRDSLNASVDRLFGRDSSDEALSRKRRNRNSADNDDAGTKRSRVNTSAIGAGSNLAPLPGGETSDLTAVLGTSQQIESSPAANTNGDTQRINETDHRLSDMSCDSPSHQSPGNDQEMLDPVTTQRPEVQQPGMNVDLDVNEANPNHNSAYPFFVNPWQANGGWYPVHPGMFYQSPNPYQQWWLQPQPGSSQQPSAKTSSKKVSANRQQATCREAQITNKHNNLPDDCRAFCVRNLSPDTTAADLSSYIVAKGIPAGAVTCSSLTKMRRNVKFLSFKVVVKRRYASTISSASFWPTGVHVASYEKATAVNLPQLA